MAEKTELETKLVNEIASLSSDPLGFVRFAFPWGSGELNGYDGPDDWQRGVLADVGAGLKSPEEALRIAVASGHGIGKSALVAWIVLWALSTRADTKGVVTANTENQLKTKTWAELAKWHRLAINAHWFRFTATAIFSADPNHEKTWRVDQVPWSENNTEAFAGLHNKGRRVLLIFDEGSAIPDSVWEVAEGALTDEGTEILWCVFGNPTRNTGRFKECFGRMAHRWKTRQIDSRSSQLTNKRQIAEWVEDYGEDSDFVRVRVRGLFPRAGSLQFIPSALVSEAMKRKITNHRDAPVLIGVDVARFGDDRSVIATRVGRDASLHPMEVFRGVDTMTLAAKVAETAKTRHADAIFVDGGGVGGGVVDRLRQLGWHPIEVQFGARAERADDYANRRAEMWGRMRDWLATGAIADDPELEAELTGVEYGYVRENVIQLERKERMKERGLASPDKADALALTFAHDIRVKNGRGLPGATAAAYSEHDYDPYATE